MNVKIKRYDKPKYVKEAVKVEELFYNGVVSFYVVSGAGARQVEAQTDDLLLIPSTNT